MLSEGRHEINAIRQRLAAANARASSSTEMLESAQQTLEIAQRNFDSSREEVEAVEALLMAAEKRWEVINIDIEEMSADPSPKRRKVSLSSSGAVRAGVSQIDATVSAAAAGQSICATGGDIEGAADASNDYAAMIQISILDNSGGLVEVVVEGCGLEEVNGAYKRDVTHSSPIFRKIVQRKEKIIVYNIFRVGSKAHSWIIASRTKGTCVRMDLYIVLRLNALVKHHQEMVGIKLHWGYSQLLLVGSYHDGCEGCPNENGGGGVEGVAKRSRKLLVGEICHWESSWRDACSYSNLTLCSDLIVCDLTKSTNDHS